MRRLAALSLFSLASFASFVGCGRGPCESACRGHCENVVVCSSGSQPEGEELDACLTSCVEYVKSTGATGDEACACTGIDACAVEPSTVWLKQYEC